MQGFGLDRTNRLQLINVAPTNLLELLLVTSLQAIHCWQLRALHTGMQLHPGVPKAVGNAGY